MTITVSPPTAAACVPSATGQPPLWQCPIPIIGLTGEYSSGKTLFGLSICPGPQTLIYDTEKSAESYRALGFVRIDVPAVMVSSHHRGYKPIDTFCWWRDHIRSLTPGEYRVIVLDTASEIESGAVDWVRANPGYFGKTAAQYLKMSGLLWGDMKELWKSLLSDLSSRCETFAFTVHMGDVWAGDKPSGKRKPRGKTTLHELASLYLQMERPKDSKGNIQASPSAVVLKSRLAHTAFDPATGVLRIANALPPRLPVATPAAIRAYLANPPDYAKLSKDERAPDPVMNDDDRAAVRLATAEAEADTERLRLERVERQERAAGRAAEKREAAVEAKEPTAATTPVPAAPSQNGQPAATAPPLTPAAAPPQLEKVTHPQLEQLTALRAEVFGLLGINGHNDKVREAWLAILAKRNVTTARDLTEAQAGELIASLTKKADHLHAPRRPATAAGGAGGSDPIPF